ncbi:hypothetical protein HMPREF0670_02803 [Prevotella sp. oral taxon 317 str. F0108]|nr:hypothetical protein HMPREF0670_02803 [Prevotella sp. oral taxon 317 str. F0108]
MYYLGTGVTEQYHFDDSGLVYLKVGDMGGEMWYGYDRLVWVENERSEGYAFVHDLFGRETLRTMMGGVDCAMQYGGGAAFTAKHNSQRSPRIGLRRTRNARLASRLRHLRQPAQPQGR